MRRVYLLCGPSLAGKSTACAAMAGALGAEVISADAINAARQIPFGAEGLPESVWAETLAEQLRQLDEHMLRGCPVVVDDTFCYRWLRDRFRERAAKGGYDVTLVLLSVSREEVLARHSRIARTGERPVLGLARLIEHLDRFEYPGPDEVVTRIGSAVEWDAWLGRERGKAA